MYHLTSIFSLFRAKISLEGKVVLMELRYMERDVGGTRDLIRASLKELSQSDLCL